MAARRCLLANHGCIAVGADLPSATILPARSRISRPNTEWHCLSATCAFSTMEKCAGSSRNFARMERRRRPIRISFLEVEDPCRTISPLRPTGYSIFRASRHGLTACRKIRALLGGRPDDWQVREVGDGNLNLVFIVQGPGGSVCVKQALPYVRRCRRLMADGARAAFFEHSYYRAVSPHVGGADSEDPSLRLGLYCTVMEFLSPHIILRQGLIAGTRYPQIRARLGDYVSARPFFASGFATPFERKMEGIALLRQTPR